MEGIRINAAEGGRKEGHPILGGALGFILLAPEGFLAALVGTVVGAELGKRIR